MKRLCVYCGSSPGKSSSYAQAARQLAQELVKRGIGLVYGGAGIGIMGLLADAVLANQGEVLGVIPQALVDKEVSHTGLTELKIVSSMHERKAMMADLSDGFIALPGGLGTLEELFEILTWAQLGFHQKPCGLLNIAGYYDGLTAFLDHAVEEQFVKPIHRSLLRVESCPIDLLDAFSSYQPPILETWLARNTT
ncbi:MAG: TIGR00730 family Rossman fold protein [Methylicorpusculum sp.]|uniref:LOG family protein n=1 Tax=Methylicorpusculum sp. TaxID=2713644 RepID=UPI002726C1B5|nr:TIGR00730 family Rossman fold protein [Methylicorpusculum sp.]MDO8938637.1 TIGR00730 family Rossman fold protein [Methylicorpusculum sp.]MDP2204315.1 TIGR00730 family Rossman fold protein [Methylicorpusculum sp.]